MRISVINKYGAKGSYTYIGRGSPFGNPYPIGPGIDRNKACDLYEVWFKDQMKDSTSDLYKAMQALKLRAEDGEHLRLACFCAPKRCHGQTLKQYLEATNKEPVVREVRIVIAGGRDFTDYAMLEREAREFIVANYTAEDRIIIVSGTARGADRLGEQFAADYGLECEQYPAQWDLFGKSAGYRRNEEMARIADAVVLFWDGASRGTSHMLEICEKKGLPGVLVNYGEDTPPWD